MLMSRFGRRKPRVYPTGPPHPHRGEGRWNVLVHRTQIVGRLKVGAAVGGARKVTAAGGIGIAGAVAVGGTGVAGAAAIGGAQNNYPFSEWLVSMRNFPI